MREFVPKAPAGWAAALFAVLLTAICTSRWLEHTRLAQRFYFDDAFITLRYARNLVDHGVLSFNSYDRVSGFTSPAWTLLLAIGIAFGADGELLMRSLSWLCGAGCVGVTGWLACRLGASPLIAIGVSAVGVASTPGFILWSIPGMETPFVALLCTAVLGVHTMGVSRRSQWLKAGVGLLCATARPECVVLVGVLICCEIARVRGRPRDALPQLLVLSVLVVLFVLHWSYYGYPAPNTFYAKRSSPGLAERGLRDLVDYLSSGFVLVALLAAGARVASSEASRLMRLTTPSALAFIAWAVASFFVYARAGGDFVGFHRYYQPLTPAAFAIVGSLVSPIVAAKPSVPHVLRVFLFSLATTLTLPALCRATLLRTFRENLGDVDLVTRFAQEWRVVGTALKEEFPTDTVIAVRAAGIIPWITGFPALDTLAINNPVIAHNNSPIRDIPGHQLEATTEQILTWRPDVMLGHPYIAPNNITGRPPGGRGTNTNALYLAAGYVYECTPLAAGNYVCYWVRRNKSRVFRHRPRTELSPSEPSQTME